MFQLGLRKEINARTDRGDLAEDSERKVELTKVSKVVAHFSY